MNMKIRDNFDWKKHLTECMESTYFCSIATLGVEGVWVCPVYFAYDDKFNFYFISQPPSRHTRNIKEDSRVAAAIYSTAQDPGGDVKGVQLEGNARILPDQEVETAHTIYYKRKDAERGLPKRSPTEHMGETAEWKFIKVTPAHIYYFDTRFFDENRIEVPASVWKWTL